MKQNLLKYKKRTTAQVLVETKLVHHTKNIKILQIPENRFCIGVFFTKLEVRMNYSCSMITHFCSVL